MMKLNFRAHKFVLNACSFFFRSIINDLPQSETATYLGWVLAQEIKPILQFMYLGQATIYQDKMNDFLNVTRSLEIKEISKIVAEENAHSSQEQDFDTKFAHGNLNEENPKQNYIEEGIQKIDTKLASCKKDPGQYSCDKCD